MSTFLTDQERQMVHLMLLKHYEVLHELSNEEWRVFNDENGGVAMVCADGDIDAFEHHRRVISHRPHCIKVFGGPLFMSRFFKGYSESAYDFLLMQIKAGMSVKKTGTFYPIFHYPCGVATLYKVGLLDSFCIARDVVNRLSQEKSLPIKRIAPMFHVRHTRPGDTKEHQRTYYVNLDALDQKLGRLMEQFKAPLCQRAA